MPKPEETATLIVKGHYFDDWESVMVTHRVAEAFATFKFTAAERDDKDIQWLKLQFKPEDDCTIYLGGVLAMTGQILTRQIAYDQDNHGVQLSGVGRTWGAARSSFVGDTGELDGKTFKQIADKLYEPTGVPIKVIGELPSKPIERVQIDPTIGNFENLEKLGRHLGVIIGSDHLGNQLLIGDHDYEPVVTLKEGVNIKRLQAIWSIENSRFDIRFQNQSQQTDGHAGPEMGQMMARVKGLLKSYSTLLVQSEHPVWTMEELKKEAENEAKWQNADNIQVTVVTYGWFRQYGNLWRTLDEVIVDSPMAMLNAASMGTDPVTGKAVQLAIEQATFAQDNDQGTTTTLLLKAPFGLNGGKRQYDARPGSPLFDLAGTAAPSIADAMAAGMDIPTPPERPPDLAPERLSDVSPAPTGPPSHNGGTWV